MTRDGFPVPPELADRIKTVCRVSLRKILTGSFFILMVNLLAENDILYRRNFSNTLKLISEEGPEVFYNGSISKSLVDYIQSRDGIMNEADLANYTLVLKSLFEGWYHGRKVITCGAPCSGPALIQALNILEGFELGKKDRITPEEVHLLVESMKCTRLSDLF